TIASAQVAAAPRGGSSDEPPEMIDEGSIGETELEFDAAGELPLRSAPPSAEDAPQPEIGEDEVPAPAAPLRPPAMRRTLLPQRTASDAKEFESHPVIKMVLKEVDGVIVGVTKKGT